MNPIPSLEKIKLIIMDFDGVFTDNSVYTTTEGTEFVKCDKYDSTGIKLFRMFLKDQNIDIPIIVCSTEKNACVLKRTQKLGLKSFLGIENKAKCISDFISSEYGNDQVSSILSQSIFLCNDVNDIPLMNIIGYSVVPLDAHWYVKQKASLVIEKNGGKGFIRQFMELLMGINTDTESSRKTIEHLLTNGYES